MTTSDTPAQYQTARMFQDMLASCQWLPREEIRRLQDAAVADIALHAWKTVPFYRDRLAPLIASKTTVDLSRWSQVPFLTREELQDSFEVLKSTDCPASHGRMHSAKSSGSTAQPVEILTTEFAATAATVASARGMGWAGIDYRLNQAQIVPMPESAAPYPGERVDASWAPYWLDDASSGSWHRLDHTTPHDLQLKWLAERGRCYLGSMPSNVAEIARRVAEQPNLKPDLAGILTLGEIVSQDLRELVRAALECEIWDGYSTNELGCLARQCRDCSNFHVTDEIALVEVVDEATGRPCAPGETGSVVVTSFFNYAMPLIRYQVGDLATVAAPASCGRGLSSLQGIVGRRRQIFRFPDGATVMPGLATRYFSGFLKARKWQVAQIGDETLEIRFISDATEDQQDRAAFADAANKRFQRELIYVFKQADEIQAQPSGKFFEYVCELPPL